MPPEIGERADNQYSGKRHAAQEHRLYDPPRGELAEPIHERKNPQKQKSPNKIQQRKNPRPRGFRRGVHLIKIIPAFASIFVRKTLENSAIPMVKKSKKCETRKPARNDRNPIEYFSKHKAKNNQNMRGAESILGAILRKEKKPARSVRIDNHYCRFKRQ
jgi:hypothetical protein